MLLVDDARIIGHRAACIPGISVRNVVTQAFDQFALFAFVHEHVVGRDAGLTGIHVLPEHQPPGREVDVGCLVHDSRAFPAQFQRDRGQMFRRGFHDDPAHRDAAGKEDVVELLLQKLGVFPAAPQYDRTIGVVKATRDELLDDFCHSRCVGRGLDHGAVACSDRADQRRDRQHKRIVPGRYDERHAVRLGNGVAGSRKQGKRCFDPFPLHPFRKTLDGNLYFAFDRADLGHISFNLGFIEIRRQRREDVGFHFADGCGQLLQRRHTKRIVQRSTRCKIRLLPFDQFGYAHRPPPFSRVFLSVAPAVPGKS